MRQNLTISAEIRHLRSGNLCPRSLNLKPTQLLRRLLLCKLLDSILVTAQGVENQVRIDYTLQESFLYSFSQSLFEVTDGYCRWLTDRQSDYLFYRGQTSKCTTQKFSRILLSRRNVTLFLFISLCTLV